MCAWLWSGLPFSVQQAHGASPAFFGWTFDWHRMHPSLVPLAIQCMFVLSPPWSSRIPRYVVTSTKLHFPYHVFPFLSFNFGFGLPSQTTPPLLHMFHQFVGYAQSSTNPFQRVGDSSHSSKIIHPRYRGWSGSNTKKPPYEVEGRFIWMWRH